MRGGVVPWKHGSGGHGIRAAVSYALGGSCDASQANEAAQDAAIAASRYAGQTVTRHVVTNGEISRGELSVDQLQTWVDGHDPENGEIRGKTMHEANAALLYDATINTPKSYSLVAMLHPELAAELSKLMDRVRDQAIVKWQTELNARRGAGSTIREDLARIEVVELDHARSRSLDPHSHRHLWLNAKVQGQDGKWSNVDSKVLMQYQPIINGEGELAARTDQQWRATLDRFGLTLDADGEITEVAHLVRPFSKREAQIQANRAEREAWWRANNPGREPSAKHLASFDSWAWAKDRPNKPTDFDELDWATKVRSELMDLDQAAGRKLDHLFARADHQLTADADKTLSAVAHVSIGELDRDLLALYATVWADNRSARSNDRFNHFTLRAGVAYAVASTNVVADRATLDELIEDVTERAVRDHTVTLTDAEHVPGHVKAFRSTATVQVKADLEALLRKVRAPGQRVGERSIRQIDQATNKHPLDARQCESAQLIAGTDRLVTITGPAGTGKTTMLKVAKKALDAQDRRMIVVAPSKKAAQVAGASVEAEAGSLHALLHSYGWRWATDQAGEHWTRLAVGDLDPQTERAYRGPAETFILRPGDRVVVDEAGMMDLYTARALLAIVDETGAGIAKVGDPRQLDPTGHGGAMALASRLADASTELSAVHRFRIGDAPDAEYAALSLRLREPADAEDAAGIANELARRGQIVRADDDAAARGMIVDKWFAVHGKGKSIAITTTTNEQAQDINEAIQARRIDQGQLDTARVAYGQHQQAFYVGDRIQTRRNDTDADVANRDEFTIISIGKDGRVVARREGDFNNDEVTLSPDYLASHAHLSYASTAHGIQGVTVDYAITAPGVTSAGLYVGMTRGVYENVVLSTATTPDAAIAEIAEAIRRGAVEDTLEQTRTQIDHEISVAAMRKVPTLTAAQQLAIDRLRTSITDRLAAVDHDIRITDVLRELAAAGEQNPWQVAIVQANAVEGLRQAERRRVNLDRLVADAERAATRLTNNNIAQTRGAVDHADRNVRDAGPIARGLRRKDAAKARSIAQRQHQIPVPVGSTRSSPSTWETWERAEIDAAVSSVRSKYAEQISASSTELLAAKRELDAARATQQAALERWHSLVDPAVPALPRGVVRAEAADLDRLALFRDRFDRQAAKLKGDLDALNGLSIEEQAQYATRIIARSKDDGSGPSQVTARFEAEQSTGKEQPLVVPGDSSKGMPS